MGASDAGTARRVASDPVAALPGDDTLRRLSRGEAGVGADALVASHIDYPAFVALCADRRRRRRLLRPFFVMTVRDAIGHGQVWAVVEGGRVQALAIWAPPATFPWSARRKVRSLPALVRVALAAPAAFPRFARYGANTGRSHPAGRHWYLIAAGVRPEVQRSGLGGRSLGPVLALADHDGAACYLETSDPANVAYYRRFGFEVVTESLRLVPDGPTHTAMRRPPQSTAVPSDRGTGPTGAGVTCG